MLLYSNPINNNIVFLGEGENEVAMEGEGENEIAMEGEEGGEQENDFVSTYLQRYGVGVQAIYRARESGVERNCF